MEFWLKIIFVILIAAGGSFIQRVSGFGFGIFAMIFLPYLVENYGSATVLSTVMSLSASVFVVYKYRKQINWRLMLPCLAGNITATYFAVQFMKTQSSAFLRGLLGCVLILLSIYFVFFAKKLKIKANAPAGVGMGLLSGVMGGLFAMGGPPVVIYFLGASGSAAIYMGTIQTYFSLSNIFGITVKAFAGFVTLDILILAAFGAIGLFAGTFAGGKLFDKLDPEKIKHIVYIVMAVSGVITLLSAIGVI